MRTLVFYRIFKVVGYVTLLLLILGIAYTSYISISHWHGIGV